jgi:hypothetical protein
VLAAVVTSTWNSYPQELAVLFQSLTYGWPPLPTSPEHQIPLSKILLNLLEMLRHW